MAGPWRGRDRRCQVSLGRLEEWLRELRELPALLQPSHHLPSVWGRPISSPAWGPLAQACCRPSASLPLSCTAPHPLHGPPAAESLLQVGFGSSRWQVSSTHRPELPAPEEPLLISRGSQERGHRALWEPRSSRGGGSGAPRARMSPHPPPLLPPFHPPLSVRANAPEPECTPPRGTSGRSRASHGPEPS